MAAGIHDSPAATPPGSAAGSACGTPAGSGPPSPSSRASVGRAGSGGGVGGPPSPRRLKAILAKALLQRGMGFGGHSSRPGSLAAAEEGVEMTEIHHAAAAGGGAGDSSWGANTSGSPAHGGGANSGGGGGGRGALHRNLSSGSLQHRRSSRCGSQAGSDWGEDRHPTLLAPTA